MEKIKKGDTSRTKTEKRAMQKISPGINDIYINSKINKEIESGRRIFKISKNFFADYKIDNGSNDIIELYNSCVTEWGGVISKNKKLLNQVVENITQAEFELRSRPKYLGKKFAKKWMHAPAKKRKVKDCDKWNYAFTQLDYYLHHNINVNVCMPKRIDRRIWHIIAAANFFGIKQDRVLKCENIMLDNYFPTFNEALQIQINELTTIEDMKYIWPQIVKKQIIYKRCSGGKNFGMSSTGKGRMQYLYNDERNKRAYEIRKENPEFTDEQIKEKLGKEKFNTNFKASYIPVMIKKCEKNINKI
ncbi:MAG: hypothetical protein PHS62_03715 [Patescibacteria group bacterium]|nr:hypothetical protein [Patescibacteria group bacterium]